MKITQEQKNFLSEYIDNLDKIIASKDVNNLLLEIDDIMLDYLDENDEPTDDYMKIEKIYDEILNQN